MKSHHLHILELDNSATDDQIRAAYRRLSKLYHPDVNKSSDAHEKFIAIRQAYEYLINGNQNVENQIFAEENELSDLEKWRIQARQKAKEKARERELYKQQLLRKTVKILTPVVIAFCLFNAALSIDYLIPRKKVDQKLITIEKIWKPSGRSGILVYRYDDWHFEDYVVRVNKREVTIKQPFDKTQVYATPFFAKPIKMILTKAGTNYEYQQLYNVFVVFGYMIPALLALSAAFFYLKNPLHKLNMAMVMIILEPVQIVIFFSL